MITYMIKVLFVQAVLWVFYRLFLKKEPFFGWNRLYLLAAIPVSFFIPLIKWNLPVQNKIYGEILEPVILDPTFAAGSLEGMRNPSYFYGLIAVYGAGVLWNMGRFVKNILRLYRLIGSRPVIRMFGYKIILLPPGSGSFSFPGYIFISQDVYKSHMREKILRHEYAHLHFRHGWDLLYYEILKIFLWFDPFVRLFQSELRLIHEFSVDRLMLRTYSSAEYIELMLQENFQTSVRFVNPFHSQIKQRVMILQKQKTTWRVVLKYAAVVFMLTAVTASFNACEKASQREEMRVITKEELKALNPNKTDKITLLPDKHAVEILTADGEKLLFYSSSLNGLLKEGAKSGRLSLRDIISRIDERNDVSFMQAAEPPVFPGCENVTGDELGNCFNRKVHETVMENFDKNLLNQIDESGKITVYAQFVIDQNGNVTDVQARSRYVILENEAKRVLGLLPRMQPAKDEHGNPIAVRYTLPIVFKKSQ